MRCKDCLCLKGINMGVKEIMRCRKGMPECKECTWKEIGCCGHSYSVKTETERAVQRKGSGNGQ